MSKRKRATLLATSFVLVLVLTLGVTAVFAQSDDGDAVPPGEETPLPERSFGMPGFPGHHELPQGLTSREELLADALGIDAETLNVARETAREAAIEQALSEGLITGEQADMLLEGSFGFHRGHGLHGFGGAIDHETLLADALNINVEELKAAQQEAHEVALAELVAAGHLTEEQVELMNVQRALKEAIDREALMAEVLGISQAELEEAHASREAMAALIEDSGLSSAEFAEAMRAAYEAAVEQAVEDGVITAEQFEALQEAAPANRGFGGCGFGGQRRGFGGHGRGGHGGPGGSGGFGPLNSFGQPSAAPTAIGFSI